MSAVNHDKTHIYHTENVTDEEVLPIKKNHSLDQIPAIVKNIQHNLLYYLKNEDDHDISQQSEHGNTIRYDDMGVTEPGNDNETHFTILIPSNHVQLKVLKKKIASQSQVFEAMLKSEMVESKRNEMTFEGSNPEAFQQVIHFIHCGSLGVPKPKYQNVKQAITLEQLIALLEIADEYQVMALIRSIAQTINEYSASILAVKSLDLSEDTQKIILKAASAIIAKKFECLMADLIYNDEWDSCIPKYSADDPPSHAELVEEIAEHVPYLKNVHPKFLGPFTMLLTTHAKLFTRLPYHFFKLILQNSNWDYDSNITLHMIFLWIIHDREGRFLDGLSILRSNYFDLTDCDVENIYHVVYQALLHVCQLPEFAKECSEFKEFVTMALFRITDAIPDEDWYNLLPNKEEKEVRNIKACMFGLDACGKTTILSKMMSHELISVTPTRGYNVGTFILDVKNTAMNITLVAIFPDTDVLFFVIDADDKKRFGQARDLLHQLLARDEFKYSKLLVYANKQDLPNAETWYAIPKELELNQSKRKYYMQVCCASTGDGLREAWEWIHMDTEPEVSYFKLDLEYDFLCDDWKELAEQFLTH